MIVVGFGMVVKLLGYLWGVLDGRVLFLVFGGVLVIGVLVW